MNSLIDASQREKALDVSQSFIVQAPAGSGKTELLTNRFVSLLNTVKNPEEIIAITFTRKAAAEMRHRILSKLPDMNSQRLRIMTIDAFCGFLVSQMPLNSKLGDFKVIESPDELYQIAINNLFLYHQDKFLEDFLLYLDNDINKVNSLCIEILKSRDQWLPHIFEWNNNIFSQVLILLVAELQLVFNQAEKYDFIEIALRALSALGDDENPTDLALKLDYQIKHLLIDEFQDTSTTQWRLLKKITAEWMPEDGRTLFLVGDPMQSIYRFRKAEVGLFFEVQKHGINNLHLDVITLSSNFRSDKKLVEWFNQSFPHIFKGEINYISCESIKDEQLNQAVFYGEVDEVVNIIKKYPTEKTAILVRAKTHIKEIIPLLQKNNISFRAIEMTNLSEHWLVQDLFSLTRALLHPADRIAWLAILRAPWCGLTLEELNNLFSKDHESTVWDLLLKANNNPRILNFISALRFAMDNRGRFSLREWVEKTWNLLEGPQCLSEKQDYKIAYQYFDLLDQYQDIISLEKALNSLSLPVDKSMKVDVEIMTIHKAKGLEFDVVILPSLERYTRADSSKLFLWEEKLNQQGEIDLLVAPIKSELYEDLKKEENTKDDQELQRLFYVACTRAKKYVYLLFSLNTKNPYKKSFLNLLWPMISNQFEFKDKKIKNKIAEYNYFLRRLPDESFSIKYAEAVKLESPVPNQFTTKHHVGTVVHEALYLISQNEYKTEDYFKSRLLQLSGSTQGFEVIKQCLKNIQEDPRAQWILKPHQEAQSEYALSTVMSTRVIIDRTFVDEENQRWIIDYKITEEIIFEEYKDQLEKYARILSQQENRVIRLGLYSPLTKIWLQV